MKYDNSFDGSLIVEIGRFFIHKPYQAGTLEQPGREKLIVNLSVFDCTTFVEAVLALSRCAVTGKISRNEFRKNLKSIRYRYGKIDGYSSRLHYFTDWLRDNEKKIFLKDLSKNLGGKAQRKKINFMTAHREFSPATVNKNQLAGISKIEKNLSRRASYIIDRDKVAVQKENIKNHPHQRQQRKP